jgi:protease-4
MKTVFTLALLAVCAWVIADDAPDTAPDSSSSVKAAATQPSAKAKKGSSDAGDEFPSPAELVKKMKQIEAHTASLTKVAYFNLTRPIEEAPAAFTIFGDDGSLTLRSLLDRLVMARQEKDVKAVLLTLGADSNINYSQAQEVRDALAAIVKSGKPVYVYADSYDTPSYTLASGANHVCMLAGGEIMIPGVGMQVTFLKGLFDKVGVKADYVQIGEYKGADEEYTRSEASEELRGELNKLTDALYDQIVEGISRSRNLPKEKVQELIDETIVTGQAAKDRGFVDHLIDQDSLRPMLAKDLGNEVDLLNDYGRPAREAVDFSNPFAMLSSIFKARSEPATDKPQVAIIYANGVITDGSGEGGMLEESGVGSETMRKAFRAATRDDNVKAVVVRIDSPGGSALASEVMWQAARHCAEKKPVIISVGSMAASGGYYLASAGDKIYADPSAIVGSIGVVGGKFVLKDLFDKLGVNTETFAKGKNAGLFSMDRPWTDRQRQMVTSWMKQTYDQFTQRVMKTRGKKIKEIDKVARGRIFLAEQAKDLGLVDEIGGVEEAIACAAKKGGLKDGEYDVRVLPQPKTLADLLMGNGPDAAMPFKPTIEIKDPLLRGLAPILRKSLGHELKMAELLQDRPVVLIAPFDVTIK